MAECDRLQPGEPAAASVTETNRDVVTNQPPATARPVKTSTLLLVLAGGRTSEPAAVWSRGGRIEDAAAACGAGETLEAQKRGKRRRHV